MNAKPTDDTATTKSRKVNTTKYRTSVKPLLDFMRKHNINEAKMQEMLCISHGTLSGWKKADSMPKWVHLALEAFTRRQGKGAARNAGKLLVVQSNGPISPRDKDVLDALGLKVVGEFNTLEFGG